MSPEEQRRRAEERLKLLNGALDVYRKAGATLQPIELPETLTRYSSAISFVLSTEAAAAFDDLTRSPGIKDESLGTWPNTFRDAPLRAGGRIHRAQRIRTLLMREMDKLMSEYDVFLSPTNSPSLGLTNLTGHPAVAIRAGFVANAPLMLMVTGRLYDEATTAARRAGARARDDVEREPDAEC